MKKLRFLAAVMVAASLAGAQAQTTTTTTSGTAAKKKTKHAETKKPDEASEEIKQLREQLSAQQAQIDALKQAISGKDQQISSTTQAASDAQQQAAAASQAAAQASAAAAATQQKTDALQGQVNDLKTTDAGLQETVVTTQKNIQEAIDSPVALHYKGLTITPVAFFAAEGVWRQHAVNSDINTPFNSIPFPSANEGHVSELNFSGRQSRLGGLFEGNAGGYKLSGYAEMDFLGTGTSSNNNQSNSYVLRQRQIWGKAETQSGFAVTGGQMWSLVTENRRSTDTRTEIQPQTVDPQYLVGYSWERQPGFRVQQRWGDVKTQAFTVALSVEQAQITSFTANGTNPADYFFGGIGQNGGLYNAAASNGGTSNITTYANNVAPDLIVKFAYDIPAFHFEVGGLGRWLRDEYLPVTAYTGTAAAPTYTYGTTLLNNTKSAGGVFGSARVYLQKYAEVAVQAMAGQGVGRYGSSQLADATLRPDETLEPIRNYHGLLSIETHPAPKLDVYFYYGGEYAQRTVYTTPQGALIGYGPANLNDSGCYAAPGGPSTAVGNAGSGGSISATNCGSPTRYIQEAMGGITYRLVNSPKYGRLQYQLTYSYIQRNLWSGSNTPSTGSPIGPTGPRATEPMVHLGMRYYIP